MKAIIENNKTYKLILVKGAYYHCEDERGSVVSEAERAGDNTISITAGGKKVLEITVCK